MKQLKYYDIKYCENLFESYVNQFYTKDVIYNEPIYSKYYHSIKVAQNAYFIASSLKNNTKINPNLCYLIGLYHDIGRFKQYQKYHTFKDSESINHAELGVENLKKNRIFLYGFDEEYKQIILSAVSNHNKKIIDKNLSELNIEYAKIIRDADKLDIYRVLYEYYTQQKYQNTTIGLHLSEENKYSKEIIDAIKQEKLADIKYMKTDNDFKLIQLSWVFDINFNYTKQKIIQNDYINMIINELYSYKQIDKIKIIINDYLQK